MCLALKLCNLETLKLALGAVAQLGERLVCNQEATGSIPVSSTKFPALGSSCWALEAEILREPRAESPEPNSTLGVNATSVNQFTVYECCNWRRTLGWKIRFQCFESFKVAKTLKL